MAVWLERDDGFVQLVAATLNANMAHLRDYGWHFPRMKIEQDGKGEIDISRIGDSA